MTARSVPPYSILVNSSDGFEDCWEPFFALFDRYWPSCNAPIFLNTETKVGAIRQRPVISTQVAKSARADRPLTWSQCLSAALGQIGTPLVLYMQEDYFLERPVAASLVDEMADLMMKDDHVRHIGLTDIGSCAPFQPTDDPRLWRISRRSRYRVSTQAGLWRVSTLASYVRPWENGWMFELFGTVRARRRNELFLTLNRDRYGSVVGGIPVMQYLHTGIIKGRWHKGVPELFARHGLSLDFGRRGFYEPPPALLRRLDLLRRIVAHPLDVARSLFG